jgi:hypothetical protein
MAHPSRKTTRENRKKYGTGLSQKNLFGHIDKTPYQALLKPVTKVVKMKGR